MSSRHLRTSPLLRNISAHPLALIDRILRSAELTPEQLADAERSYRAVTLPSTDEPWVPDHGYTVTIVVPEKLMNRQNADEFLKSEMHAANVLVQLKDGRDVSVYVLPRKTASSPLHILDIPTTLLTSEKVIRRVDGFWGGGDRDFRERLFRRELIAFGRRMRGLIVEEQLSERRVLVVEIADLREHVATLNS
jgi:hypothetical protein